MVNKVKIFVGEVEKVEEEINEFIKEKELVEIRQTVKEIDNKGELYVTIVYKEEDKGDEELEGGIQFFGEIEYE